MVFLWCFGQRQKRSQSLQDDWLPCPAVAEVEGAQDRTGTTSCDRRASCSKSSGNAESGSSQASGLQFQGPGAAVARWATAALTQAPGLHLVIDEEGQAVGSHGPLEGLQPAQREGAGEAAATQGRYAPQAVQAGEQVPFHDALAALLGPQAATEALEAVASGHMFKGLVEFEEKQGPGAAAAGELSGRANCQGQSQLAVCEEGYEGSSRPSESLPQDLDADMSDPGVRLTPSSSQNVAPTNLLQTGQAGQQEEQQEEQQGERGSAAGPRQEQDLSSSLTRKSSSKLGLSRSQPPVRKDTSSSTPPTLDRMATSSLLGSSSAHYYDTLGGPPPSLLGALSPLHHQGATNADSGQTDSGQTEHEKVSIDRFASRLRSMPDAVGHLMQQEQQEGQQLKLGSAEDGAVANRPVRRPVPKRSASFIVPQQRASHGSQSQGVRLPSSSQATPRVRSLLLSSLGMHGQASDSTTETMGTITTLPVDGEDHQRIDKIASAPRLGSAAAATLHILPSRTRDFESAGSGPSSLKASQQANSAGDQPLACIYPPPPAPGNSKVSLLSGMSTLDASPSTLSIAHDSLFTTLLVDMEGGGEPRGEGAAGPGSGGREQQQQQQENRGLSSVALSGLPHIAEAAAGTVSARTSASAPAAGASTPSTADSASAAAAVLPSTGAQTSVIAGAAAAAASAGAAGAGAMPGAGAVGPPAMLGFGGGPSQTMLAPERSRMLETVKERSSFSSLDTTAIHTGAFAGSPRHGFPSSSEATGGHAMGAHASGAHASSACTQGSAGSGGSTGGSSGRSQPHGNSHNTGNSHDGHSHANGKVVLEVTVKAVTAADGGRGLLVTGHDVSSYVMSESLLCHMAEAHLRLLADSLPRHVLEFMSATPQEDVQPQMAGLARHHSGITLLFLDMVGFTSMSKMVMPEEVMATVNALFARFDQLVDVHGVHKVETAGDCYIVSSGILEARDDGFLHLMDGATDPYENARRMMAFAKDMLVAARGVVMPHNGEPVCVRIGLHSGDVVSGMIGSKLPKFSLFGDTMNTASRMESTAPPGRIQVSAATHSFLASEEQWEPTGGIPVKGKGMMETFLWVPPPEGPSPRPSTSGPEGPATTTTTSCGNQLEEARSTNNMEEARSSTRSSSRDKLGPGGVGGPVMYGLPMPTPLMLAMASARPAAQGHRVSLDVKQISKIPSLPVGIHLPMDRSGLAQAVQGLVRAPTSFRSVGSDQAPQPPSSSTPTGSLRLAGLPEQSVVAAAVATTTTTDTDADTSSVSGVAGAIAAASGGGLRAAGPAPSIRLALGSGQGSGRLGAREGAGPAPFVALLQACRSVAATHVVHGDPLHLSSSSHAGGSMQLLHGGGSGNGGSACGSPALLGTLTDIHSNGGHTFGPASLGRGTDHMAAVHTLTAARSTLTAGLPAGAGTAAVLRARAGHLYGAHGPHGAAPSGLSRASFDVASDRSGQASAGLRPLAQPATAAVTASATPTGAWERALQASLGARVSQTPSRASTGVAAAVAPRQGSAAEAAPSPSSSSFSSQLLRPSSLGQAPEGGLPSEPPANSGQPRDPLSFAQLLPHPPRLGPSTPKVRLEGKALAEGRPRLLAAAQAMQLQQLGGAEDRGQGQAGGSTRPGAAGTGGVLLPAVSEPLSDGALEAALGFDI